MVKGGVQTLGKHIPHVVRQGVWPRAKCNPEMRRQYHEAWVEEQGATLLGMDKAMRWALGGGGAVRGSGYHGKCCAGLSPGMGYARSMCCIGNVLLGPIGDLRVNNRQIATCSEGVRGAVYPLRDVDEGLVVWVLTEGQCGVAPVEMPSRRQLRVRAVVWGEVVRLHVFAWGNVARAQLEAIKSMVDGWGEQWHVSACS